MGRQQILSFCIELRVAYTIHRPIRLTSFFFFLRQWIPHDLIWKGRVHSLIQKRAVLWHIGGVVQKLSTSIVNLYPEIKYLMLRLITLTGASQVKWLTVIVRCCIQIVKRARGTICTGNIAVCFTICSPSLSRSVTRPVRVPGRSIILLYFRRKKREKKW